MTSYLNFVEQPNPGKLTKQWHVYSKTEYSAGHPLGIIYYRPGWRKYVFESSNAAYDINCLTEIMNFLKDHKDDRQ